MNSEALGWINMLSALALIPWLLVLLVDGARRWAATVRDGTAGPSRVPLGSAGYSWWGGLAYLAQGFVHWWRQDLLFAGWLAIVGAALMVLPAWQRRHPRVEDAR